MGYLAAMIALGVFNITLQNYYCKNLFRTRSDNFAYSIILYAIGAVTVFIINGCKIGRLSAFTLLDCMLYGSMLTLELYCTLQAYKCGSMSLTSMFIMASIMVPAIPSWLFWGDPVTWQQIAGIAVLFAAIALILNVGSDIGSVGVNWKWFLYSFIAFIGSGMAGIAEKILTVSEYASQSNDFVFVGLLFAILTMAAVLLILRRKEPVTIKLTPKVVLPTAAMGIGHGLICVLTMLVLAVLPASVAYSINNGARILLVTVIDIVLFKEKLTKPQYIGLALGIAGVVLLSTAP